MAFPPHAYQSRKPCISRRHTPSSPLMAPTSMGFGPVLHEDTVRREVPDLVPNPLIRGARIEGVTPRGSSGRRQRCASPKRFLPVIAMKGIHEGHCSVAVFLAQRHDPHEVCRCPGRCGGLYVWWTMTMPRCRSHREPPHHNEGFLPSTSSKYIPDMFWTSPRPMSCGCPSPWTSESDTHRWTRSSKRHGRGSSNASHRFRRSP